AISSLCDMWTFKCNLQKTRWSICCTNYRIKKLNIKRKNQNNCLNQNQPEGISMAVPMKNGGMSARKVIFYVVLSGITTGIGAFFGVIIGSISEQIISLCLSFAAGAMLYIVSRRINTRIQYFISWKNDSSWKYDGIFNRVICNDNLKY